MFFLLANVVVMAFASVVSWWLSGYDTHLTGQNVKADHLRRCIRCGITLCLVEVGFMCLWLYGRYNDVVAGALYLGIALPMGLTWIGCISEMLAQGFNWLFDPGDHRPSDLDKSQRDQDAIAHLVKNGPQTSSHRIVPAAQGIGGCQCAGDGCHAGTSRCPAKSGSQTKTAERSFPFAITGKFQGGGSHSQNPDAGKPPQMWTRP